MADEREGKVCSQRWQRIFAGPASSAVHIGSNIDPSTRLYRYMDWKWVKAMFLEPSMRFASPTTWIDPYERWWCEQLFRADSALSDAHAYACCFTTAHGDEPYWRLYDHGGKIAVVRAGTTVQRLVEVLVEYVKAHEAQAYLGKVNYVDVVRLRFAASLMRRSSRDATEVVADALTMKRAAFRIESEYRAIVIDRHAISPARFLFSDPRITFSQLMIAPSVSERRANAIRKELGTFDFPPIKVRRSSLYDLPDKPRKAIVLDPVSARLIGVPAFSPKGKAGQK